MIKIKTLNPLWAALLVCLITTHVLAETITPKPYRAVYTAKYTFILPLHGEAVRELKRNEQGDWELSHKVNSSLAKISESSLFKWQNGQVLPLKYRFEQKTIGKDRSLNLDFVRDQGQVVVLTHPDNSPYPLVDGLQDKLSYQLKLREDLLNGGLAEEYLIADSDGPRDYRFEMMGEEVITTQAGKFRTLKIRRDRDENARRESVVWLAPDWDYLVVKIEQTEKGKTYTVELKEGELDGTAIHGIDKA